jgi:hypothetical protein
MLWLTFFYLSIPNYLPDEILLVQASSVTKNILLGLEKKPDTTRFLFINVAWDKVMVEHLDADSVPVGVEPITDRQKLIDLLTVIKHRSDYKFIVFDINFKGATIHDSLLTAQINSMKNFAVSYHRDEKDKPDYPDLKIKHLGLSDIEKVYDMAFKFKIFFNDSIKSTPLVMYENITKKKFAKNNWGIGLCWLNNNLALNSFILDYRIRDFDYKAGKYSKLHLGEYLALMTDSTGAVNPESNPEFLNLFKDRIVFVGDFEDRDIHETIYGKIPGPLILLDAFLALEAGDNLIRPAYILFLFVCYAFISYVTLAYNHIYGKWLMIVFFKKKLKETFLESMTVYFLYFVTISIISYFIFELQFGVLVLAFYMNLFVKAKQIIINRFFHKKGIALEESA